MPQVVKAHWPGNRPRPKFHSAGSASPQLGVAMPLGPRKPAASLTSAADVLVALYQPRAPRCVAQNLLRISFLGSHSSIGTGKDEFSRGVFQSVLEIGEHGSRDRENVRVFPLCGVGIVRAADNDEAVA